jgi:hypothetical protein
MNRDSRQSPGGGQSNPGSEPLAPPTAPIESPASCREQRTPSAIWNPNAAANWSLVFSPVFGSILIWANLRALGQFEGARRAGNWAIVTLAWMVLVQFIPDSKTGETVIALASLTWLLVWYYALARPHIRDVQARFGMCYPRRKWGKPFGLALLALVTTGVLVGILAPH